MVTVKAVIESSTEDLSSINADIAALSSKFIDIINKLRSIAKPSPTTGANSTSRTDVTGSEIQGNFEGIQINTTRPMESRVSAFYRMLGFPIMDNSGDFYNSGFDPNYVNNVNKRNRINNNILSGPLEPILGIRETQPEKRRLIFAAQGFEATAYSVAIRFIKPFIVMDRNLLPMDLDIQFFQVTDRAIGLATYSDLYDIDTAEFGRGQHILKPFIVDPRINGTIMPDTNMICVPFLKTKEDTQLAPGKTLLRPGIEFICRQRLKDTKLDKQFLSEAKRILSNSSASNDDTINDVKDAIIAISDDNNSNSSSILNTVNKLSTVQIGTITILVKAIKATVQSLDEAIVDLDVAITKYNIQPVPGVDGPESSTGGFIRTTGFPSDLDMKIATLKLEQQIEQYRNVLQSQQLGATDADLGSLFAIPAITTSIQNDFSSPIQQLERIRDQVGSLALQNIANIERVTGEVSGLGLVDVLAIYTALWAIDIETLIGFLDDDAFKRLYDFNPDLRAPEVESRKAGNNKNGIDVLTEFERKLFNILSFADKYASTQARVSPLAADSGDGSQG